MLFNSFQFLIFFSLVTSLYFAVPHRFRWPILFVASCYFYMVLVPEYILILFFLILVDYSAGLLIQRATGRSRKTILIVSLIANIGVLALFKYFNFFNENLHALFESAGLHYGVPAFSLILPIGLSFHTFQSMSYTIEVYKGNYKAERHLGLYALYVLFYPQMVAGPIERPHNLLPQFHREQEFDYQRIADGMKQMVWGLFKKVVVADRLAILVNTVYDHPSQHTGLPLVVATYFFAFQIYCDFSGYTDIAIGAAKVMGINLMTNFTMPYHARSIGEFWKRWHISLSSWFRDYLYIPLGGNRVAPARMYFNMFFVFLVSGFWHGANWTFLVWGALHGFYLIAGHLTTSIRGRFIRNTGLDRHPVIVNGLRIFITFHLVALSWILFRAHSIHDAWYIITNMAGPARPSSLLDLGLGRLEMTIALLSLAVLIGVDVLREQKTIIQRLRMQPAWLRWTCYSGAVAVILLFGKFISLDFIYFQF